MNFSSPLYFLFLVSIFLIFYTLQKSPVLSKFINFTLLIFSYLFYSFWNPTYLLLIVYTTIFDYYWAFLLDKQNGFKRIVFLFPPLLNSLGILFFFKYYGLFSSLMLNFSNFLSFDLRLPVLDLLLPVGISFYTFQSISYIVDIYRKQTSPEKKLVNYALFLAFFPQLVAGPIVLAKDLIPQFEYLKDPKPIDYSSSFFLFLLGYSKKSLIADQFAPIVDTMYNFPSVFTSLDWYLGVLAYSFQIYFDFSGYTDFAIATAILFGIRLPENFRFPYLSFSVTEFWHRWHISLSQWLRDYLYISLGGNRKGAFRTLVNLFLTMLIGGLWHGANWAFLLWGGAHGLLLIAERVVQNVRKSISPEGVTPQNVKKPHIWINNFIRFLLTFGSITFLWVLFRSQDFSTAILIYKKLIFFESGFSINYKDRLFLSSSIVIVLCAMLIGYFKYDSIIQSVRFNYSLKLSFFYILWFFICVIFSRESRPFLYFVF
jgi:alginate O-acetyltransferase complex protein AlgI